MCIWNTNRMYKHMMKTTELFFKPPWKFTKLNAKKNPLCPWNKKYTFPPKNYTFHILMLYNKTKTYNNSLIHNNTLWKVKMYSLTTFESKGIFIHYKNWKKNHLHIIAYSQVCSGKYVALNTCILKMKKKGAAGGSVG